MEDSETPREHQSPVLPEHLPYVLVLGDAIPILNSVATGLGEVLHEMRVAREPVVDRVLRRISELGAALESVGGNIRRGFARQP